MAADMRQPTASDITQANVDTLITVFGGSGFLGRHVVRALGKRGYRIRVAVRRPELAGHLQPLGRVGQIHAVQANLRYPQLGRGRGARRRRGDQSGRHPVRARPPAVRRGAGVRRRSGARWRRRPMARGWCTSRRSAPTRTRPRPMPAPRAWARSWCSPRCRRRDDPAAVGRVRPGGRLLQPLRRDRALRAGAAAGRRRPHPLPAGLCRRRRGRGGRGGRGPRRAAAASTSSAGRRCRRSRSCCSSCSRPSSASGCWCRCRSRWRSCRPGSCSSCRSRR